VSRKKQQDIAKYLGAVRRLTKRNKAGQIPFPTLIKYKRRKTLKPHEKGHIMRMLKRYEQWTLPKYQREAAYENVKSPPGFAIWPDKSYKNVGRELLPFLENKETMRKILRQRGKLKPWQKAYIRRFRNLLPFTEGLIPISKEEADNLPDAAVRGRREDKEGVRHDAGIYAIKLLETDPETEKIDFLDDGEIIVDSPVDTIYYRPVEFSWLDETGYPQEDEVYRIFEEAAQAAFDNGAAQIWFWTINGIAGDYAATPKQFVQMLGSQYMEYLRSAHEAGRETDWLLGIAILYRKKKVVKKKRKGKK
jgi:hypothetical protein